MWRSRATCQRIDVGGTNFRVRGRGFQSPFEVGHHSQSYALGAEVFDGVLDHFAESFDFLVHAVFEKKIWLAIFHGCSPPMSFPRLA